jgi:hypothetical protein
MGEPARKLWREVVEARPPAFFMSGTQNLLRTFCEVSVALEAMGPRMLAAPDDARLLRRMAILANLQVLLASKLRLTVQSVLRGDKVAVYERTPPVPPSTDPLFQGRAAFMKKKPEPDT